MSSSHFYPLCYHHNITRFIFLNSSTITFNPKQLNILLTSNQENNKQQPNPSLWYIKYIHSYLDQPNKSSYQNSLNSEVILITGAMHPREDTSFRFIKYAIQKLIASFGQNNKEMQYLLNKVIILVIPFVNIDSIKKIIALGTNNFEIRKNMNPEKSETCQKSSQRGVDINRNFDYNFGKLKASSDPCSEQYRGIKPFSQPESQSILQIFTNFKVLTNIDVHSFGNIWIYPYASQEQSSKIKQHQLYVVYQQIFKKFQQTKVGYANCFESLKYTADGVYIDWALEKGSISFALQFGDDFDKIGQQMQKHYNALITLLTTSTQNIKTELRQSKDNSMNYQLCVQSFSTMSHELSLFVQTKLKETITVQRLASSCFTNFFKPSQINNNQVFIKLGNLIEIKIDPITENLTQSILYTLFTQFKTYIIIIVVLYCIGSLCGLSIFCQRSLGIQKYEEEFGSLKGVASMQIIDSERGMRLQKDEQEGEEGLK